MKNMILISLFAIGGCAHLTVAPPSPRVQMECNTVDLGSTEVTGLVCRTASLNQFGDFFNKTLAWTDAAWAKCGPKQKPVKK